MNELLPGYTTLSAFLLASLVLAATPGPGVVYIVTRTVAQGRRAGLASVAGVALGNLGNAIGASLGLAAIFAVSSAAFSIVRLAGAAYLMYLGFRALRPATAEPERARRLTPRFALIFRDGFLVSLLNPKTTIFFAAFLPQFIEPGSSTTVQSVAFGAAFVLIAATTDTVYVLAAAMTAPGWNMSPRGAMLGRYASASVYFGLGLLTAVSGTRSTR